MAVKISRALFLALLLLSLGLLLFGCTEKHQTVSETGKRSDFSDINSSTPGGSAPPESPTANADDTEQKKPGSPETVTGTQAPVVKTEKNPANETATDNKEPAKEKVAAGSNSGQLVEIKFSEMYAGGSSRGLKFSDKLTGLNGKKVVITGYMAPPLKPSFTFFVLTRQPMAICPFCSTDASWPEDIILIYLPKGEDQTPTDAVLRVTGTLELGSHTDSETGFVSQARIHADKIEVVR